MPTTDKPDPLALAAASAQASRTLTGLPARLLTTRDLETLTGERAQTWRLRRGRGDTPPYHRIGNRCYYDPADVAAWLAARKVCSTA